MRKQSEGFAAHGRSTTQIGGRIIDENGKVKKCCHCGGTRGWNVTAGITTHQDCGAVQ